MWFFRQTGNGITAPLSGFRGLPSESENEHPQNGSFFVPFFTDCTDCTVERLGKFHGFLKARHLYKVKEAWSSVLSELAKMQVLARFNITMWTALWMKAHGLQLFCWSLSNLIHICCISESCHTWRSFAGLSEVASAARSGFDVEALELHQSVFEFVSKLWMIWFDYIFDWFGHLLDQICQSGPCLQEDSTKGLWVKATVGLHAVVMWCYGYIFYVFAFFHGS